MAQEPIIGDDEVNRLMECMKMNQALEEAQSRTMVARNKLVDAAAADVDSDLEEFIQEVVAAAEHETRVVARNLQNREWMRRMKDKIKEKTDA